MEPGVTWCCRFVRAALAASAVLGVTPLLGGGWHSGETLVCSDCHTIHNSMQGQPMRYDGSTVPAERLLRAEDPTHLCLACHDGSLATAPDVVAPVSYVPDPAGGWFLDNPVGQVNPNGHDIAPPSAQQSPGSADSFALTCASCHATHGSTSYRNLLEEPPGTGNAGPVTVLVNELVPPDGSNPGQVYVQSNLFHKAGMAAWCNDCHGNFHGTTSNEEGTESPWLRHPQSQEIAASDSTDFTHWSGTIADRVPVETPGDDTIPSADDVVFCLSCHKAHGSPQPDGLIYADGTTKLSTCQQCHNQ